MISKVIDMPKKKKKRVGVRVGEIPKWSSG